MFKKNLFVVFAILIAAFFGGTTLFGCGGDGSDPPTICVEGTGGASPNCVTTTDTDTSITTDTSTATSTTTDGYLTLTMNTWEIAMEKEVGDNFYGYEFNVTSQTGGSFTADIVNGRPSDPANFAGNITKDGSWTFTIGNGRFEGKVVDFTKTCWYNFTTGCINLVVKGKFYHIKTGEHLGIFTMTPRSGSN